MRVIDISGEDMILNGDLNEIGAEFVGVDGDDDWRVNTYKDRHNVIFVEFDSCTNNDTYVRDRVNLVLTDPEAIIFYCDRPAGYAFRLATSPEAIESNKEKLESYSFSGEDRYFRELRKRRQK